MNTKIVAIAAILCGTLAACATTRQWPPPPPMTMHNTKECKKNQPCEADVTVTDDGTVCKLQVVLFISIKDLDLNADHDITWKLPANYKFSNERYKYGIFIKDDPRKAIQTTTITASGRELTLRFSKNAATANQQYAYALSVQRSNDSFCETLDPWFIS